MDKEICEILRRKPYTRPVDIARQIGKKTTQVQNVLGRLLHEDKVIREKIGYRVKDIARERMIRSLICEGRWV